MTFSGMGSIGRVGSVTGFYKPTILHSNKKFTFPSDFPGPKKVQNLGVTGSSPSKPAHDIFRENVTLFVPPRSLLKKIGFKSFFSH